MIPQLTETPFTRLQITCTPAPNFTTPSQRVFSIVPSNAPNGGQDAGEAVFAVYNNGFVYAREVQVKPANPWPDYVFEAGYELMPLDSLEAYVAEERHLPGIPSTEDVAQEGLELGQMNARLLEKVEELT